MVLDIYLYETEKAIAILIVAIVVILAILKGGRRKPSIYKDMNGKFPELWREILKKRVVFYKYLDEPDRRLFETRITRFLSSKAIDGVGTEIDDTIRLMVASSAIIPTFAFPEYNYPKVNTILIYPNSFDMEFETAHYKGRKQFISGMVGDGALNGTVILSKPDLEKAFDGIPHKTNVGVHEFVHLLDNEDGAIDGIPKVLVDETFVGQWLEDVKKEMRKIENGTSDINPYGLTNNAEFLAVVSEYFFDNPDKFKKRHPELYNSLCTFFHQGESVEKESVKVN